jgi:hypothetical protein
MFDGWRRNPLGMSGAWRTLVKWLFSSIRILGFDLTASLILFGLGAAWWSDLLHSPGWNPDGMQYQTGIALVQMGRSPYEQTIFPYPPTIAVLGAWISGISGHELFRTIFRYANLLGGCAAVWGSVLFIRAPGWIKLVIATLGVAFLPALSDGLENDNLSVLAGGLSILALVFWQRLPIAMGIMLGFGLALKPVAMAALFVLAAHRNPLFKREQALASLAACASGGLLILLKPSYLLSAGSQPSIQAAVADWASAVQNVSLFRVLASFGLEVSPFYILAAIVLGTIVYVRTRPLNPVQLLCVALTSSLLSLPIVWQHTLLLITPVAITAAAFAVEDFKRVSKNPEGPQGRNIKLRSLTRLLLVVSGARVLLEANAFGVLANWNPMVNGVAHLIPLTTLLLLTVFVVKHEDRRASGSPAGDLVHEP